MALTALASDIPTSLVGDYSFTDRRFSPRLTAIVTGEGHSDALRDESKAS